MTRIRKLHLHQRDNTTAEQHARAMLTALGIACDREQTLDTPRRLVAALNELTAGIELDPARHLARTFPGEAPTKDQGMVTVVGIPLVSLCEHHMLPFVGTAAVAYLPVDRIVGLSKIARMVAEYAARPQVQERLGWQIVEAIVSRLDTLGAACVLRSRHCCMTLRGACATSGEMVTSHLTGLFKDDAAARGEFLTLAHQATPAA